MRAAAAVLARRLSLAPFPALFLALVPAWAMAQPAPAHLAPAEPGSASTPTTDSWNQWRGPNRDGTIAGPEWPQALDGLERLWRVELGEGYSGAIVSTDRVFVVESIDNREEAVRALDRRSGAELWSVSWEATGSVPFFARRNGDWVRATPVYDGEALYVGGMEEVLVKLDAATGRELWRVDFPQRFGTRTPDFGFASSPLLHGEALYVQAANSLVKLDLGTGETLWRSLESAGDMMDSGAFSSPVVATLGGLPQLVVGSRHRLHGVTLDSGEVLWSHDVPNFRGMNILTPLVHGDSVFTSSHRNGSYRYDISESEDGFVVVEAWRNKVQGYMSSPVVVDGHVYLHLGNGRLACLDLASGRETWISKPFGDYWSLIAQGDSILALDADGELHLLRANPEALELLDSRSVAAEPTWGHLAVSGRELFVRELNAVTAYRWIP